MVWPWIAVWVCQDILRLLIRLHYWIRNTNKDVIAKIILCWKEALGLPSYASDHYINTENSQTWELQCHMFVDCTTYPDPYLKSSKTNINNIFCLKNLSMSPYTITLTLTSPSHLYCMFISTSCGQVVRDFEREAKTRCNF